MNTYSFEISSKYGFFQWDKTKGDRRVSLQFLSKTDVLGILGAIIGLDGYAQQNLRTKFKSESKPVFYNELKGLEVSIVPLSRPEYVQDQLIHRHFYGVNSRGSLMVNLSLLFEPRFQIFIRQGSVDDSQFQKIIEYLSNGWAEFIPYLGKNNFPLTIEQFKKENLSIDSNTSTCDSLILRSDIDGDIEVADELNEDVISESLKFFDETSNLPKIINKHMIWTNTEIDLLTDIFSNGDKKIVFY